MPEEFQTGHESYDGTSSTRRPGALSLDYLISWSIGPNAINDTSLGLVYRVWRIRVDNLLGKAYLQRAAEPIGEAQDGWDPEFELFSFTITEIEEVDLAFDQNGAPVVCAQRSGTALWLYWFSPFAGTYVFEEIGEGRNPRLLLDDPINLDLSDILLFYVNDTAGAPQVRSQGALYADPTNVPINLWIDVETGLPAVIPDVADLFMEEVAKAVDNRVHLFASLRDSGGNYKLLAIETVPYPYYDREEFSVTQRIQELASIFYMLPADWQQEDLSVTQRIETLDAIELVLFVAPEGPDGFISPEERLENTQRIQTATVINLVLNVGIAGPDGYLAADENLKATQRIQTAVVTVVVLVVPTLIDNFKPTQRIQSLTVSAA